MDGNGYRSFFNSMSAIYGLYKTNSTLNNNVKKLIVKSNMAILHTYCPADPKQHPDYKTSSLSKDLRNYTNH